MKWLATSDKDGDTSSRYTLLRRRLSCATHMTKLSSHSNGFFMSTECCFGVTHNACGPCGPPRQHPLCPRHHLRHQHRPLPFRRDSISRRLITPQVTNEGHVMAHLFAKSKHWPLAAHDLCVGWNVSFVIVLTGPWQTTVSWSAVANFHFKFVS